MTEEKKKADPMGLVALVVVVLAVLGGIFLVHETVRSQGDAAQLSLQSAVEQLSTENRMVRESSRTILEEVRQFQRQFAAMQAVHATPGVAAPVPTP